MKIIFFGTPDYVVPVLEALHKRFKAKNGESPILAVVTQAPKPVGRKQFLVYSPVDNWAHTHKVPKYFSAQELLSDGVSADLGVLASYGEILPKEVLNLFPHGTLNIHPSLLPKYRGASPIQAAILTGDTECGVSIIKLDEKLDHGGIVSQFTEPILGNDTFEALRTRLFARSAEVLTDLVTPYTQGKIKIKPQNDAEASYTVRITKEDGFIPPAYLEASFKGSTFEGEWKIKFIKNCILPATSYVLHNFIRAMIPWPIAWTMIKTQTGTLRLKILKARVEDERLILMTVQLEGKNPVSWDEFRRGYPNATLE